MGLSQPVGVLLKLLDDQRESTKFDCDLLIIGSGYGGAVAAARFAAAKEADGQPTRVWLLERGAEYLPGEFPSRFAELPGHVRFTMDDGQVRGRCRGLLDLRIGKDVSVLLGNGLGGGSLINASVMAKPDEEVFAKGWPSAIENDRAALEAGYARAHKMLRPKPLPATESLRKLELLRSLTPDAPAVRAEVHVAWADGLSKAGVQMRACTACGDCLTGCNQGAKGSLDTNYLAWAFRRGVRMFTGVAATSVEPDPDGGWLLNWSPTDTAERAAYADEATPSKEAAAQTIGGLKAPRPVRARRVILAAGTLGSTEILLRSWKLQKLHLSEVLGEGFSMNGDNIVAGLGHPKPTGTVADPEINPGARRNPAKEAAVETRRIGPTITGLKRVPARGFGAEPGFVIEEFAVPGALRRVFGEIVATLAAVRGLPMPGDDASACTEAHIDRMSCYGLMGNDGAGGRLELPPEAKAGIDVGRSSRRGHRLELPPEAKAGIEGQLRVRWEGVSDLPLFASMASWLLLAFASKAPRTPTAARPLPLVGEAVDGLDAVRLKAQAWLGKRLPAIPAAVRDLLIDRVAPLLPPDLVLSALGGGVGMAVTVHPLGGCRMADNATQGVVDADGRVWNFNTGKTYEGLAVLDGAIVPRALGINPAFTITALAERAVPNLATSFGVTLAEDTEFPGELTLPDRTPAPTRPLPYPSAPYQPLSRQPLPPAEATWQLREVLQGRFTLGDVKCWARLRLSYEDIPGLARALQSPDRQLNIRNGTLELYKLNPDRALARIPAEFLAPRWPEKPFVVAEVRGHLRLFMPLANGDPQDPRDDERVTLDYRLTLMGVNMPYQAGEQPLQTGMSLNARKLVGKPPDQSFDRAPSWLRQLTEAEVRLGDKPVGRWALDYDDLASRRDPLLSLLRHSSLPDALLDAASGGLHVARLLLPLLKQAFAFSNHSPWAPNLLASAAARWPGPVAGQEPLPFWPKVKGVPQTNGPRLSCYRWGKVQGMPVLLIHGTGAGGNSYTLSCVADAPLSLMSRLREANREVWVLDLRSSIGNETGRQEASSQDWRAETVGCKDIEWAIKTVLKKTETGNKKIDVFAHCMGAVMLWMAVLSIKELGPKIHAAVFSQVGPKLLPTPYNRLRGFIASYLLQFARIKEVDTCPDFEFNKTDKTDKTDKKKWSQKCSRSAAMGWLDTILATFPYPDDDGEADRADAMGEQGWRSVRHRADAIFGQLFELKNLSDATLLQLDALLGWVKMPMLAQAIHFARLRIITNDEGRNVWLNQDNLRERLPFPLMIIHGRRNRVFDWHGSVDSLELLKNIVGEKFERNVNSEKGLAYYGAGSSRQLLIFEKYGHFDCVLGEHAGADIMGQVTNFLAAPPEWKPRLSRPTFEVVTPLIGPQLGLLQVLSETAKHDLTLPAEDNWYALQLLLQPKSRVANTSAWMLLPVDWRGGVPTPDYEQAEMFTWTGGFEPATLKLWFDRDALAARASTWAVLMLDDVDKTAKDNEKTKSGRQVPRQAIQTTGVWRLGPDAKTLSQPLTRRLQIKVCRWLRAKGSEGLYDDCQLHLPPHVLDAASQPLLRAGDSANRRTKRVLGLALASCQYPPDIADQLPAEASFRALLARARRADGPQALLLVGDQTYLDRNAGLFDPPSGSSDVEGKAAHQQDIRQAYELVARLPSRRRTLARLPSYSMLDDHEVADNWRGRKADHQIATGDALKAFNTYQRQLGPLPTSTRADASYGYYCQPAGLPLFVLDTRSQRDKRGPQALHTAHILPEEELDALINELILLQRKHPGLPKLIVSPVPLLPLRRQVSACDGASMFEDDWAGYPASMRKLLGAVQEHGIRKLVLLSGDSHLSSVSRLKLDDGNQIVSVASSGLYAPWPFANQRPDELYSGATSKARHGADGQMTVEAVQTANGFALVDLLWESKRQDADSKAGWTLEVNLCGNADEFIRRRIPLD